MTTAPKTTQKATRVTKSTKTRPRQTKRDQLVALLKRSGGSDIATISTKLGWQHHSTRAALTGLRKAGFTIERVASGTDGRAARYRISEELKMASASD